MPRRHFVAGLVLIGLLRPGSAPALDWTGKLHRDGKELRSQDPKVRLRALDRLRQYPPEQSKPYLLSALSDLDPQVQLEAARLVAEHRFREAVPPFLRWLSQPEPSLRGSAAEALGKLGDPAAVRPLSRSLSDPEQEVRQRVAAALGQLRTKDQLEVLALLGRLNLEPSSAVRKVIIEALARKRDRRSLIPLIGRLSDTSHETRLAAAVALGELGDPAAGRAVLRLVRDSNPDVSAAAIDALGKLRFIGAVESMIDLLQSSSTQRRERAAAALGGIANARAVRALLASLARGQISAAVRRALIEAGEAAAPQLNTALQDPRTPLGTARAIIDICREGRITATVPALLSELRLGRLPRVQLIRALGAIGDPRAQRPLLELLESPSAELRTTLLEALEPILDERAADPLLPLLHDPNLGIRRSTIEYLGRLRSRLATPELIGIACGQDRPLAEPALRALASIRDPRAAMPLVGLLSHEDRTMRRLASLALSRIQSPTVVQPVLELCRQATPAIKVTCLQTIGGILRGRSDEQSLALLNGVLQENDRSLLLAAIDALAALRDPRVPEILVRRYPSLDPPLQRKILEALGNHRGHDKLLTPVLLGALQAKDSSVRAAAAWAAGKLQLAGAQSALRDASADRSWEVRANAVAGLAQSRAPQLGPLWRTLIGDSSPWVRANAALGLAMSGDPAARDLLAESIRGDKSAWVRINALRGLWQLSSPRAASAAELASVSRLAQTMATEDPDPRVRLLAERLSRPAEDTPAEGDWIGLFLLGEDQRPLRDALFLLITPTGMVKAAWSDAMAEAWEEGLPAGRCYVELPAAQAGLSAAGAPRSSSGER